jgi:hypothetical protein
VRITKEDLNVLVLPVILLAPVIREVALLMVSEFLEEGLQSINSLFLNVFRAGTNATNYN